MRRVQLHDGCHLRRGLGAGPAGGGAAAVLAAPRPREEVPHCTDGCMRRLYLWARGLRRSGDLLLTGGSQFGGGARAGRDPGPVRSLELSAAGYRPRTGAAAVAHGARRERQWNRWQAVLTFRALRCGIAQPLALAPPVAWLATRASDVIRGLKGGISPPSHLQGGPGSVIHWGRYRTRPGRAM